MFHRFSIFGIAILFGACASEPPPPPAAKYDETKRLALPCLALPERATDAWYVRIVRDEEPDQFTNGAFVARVSVWVTIPREGEQLITVLVGANEDRARLDTGRASTGRGISGKEIISAAPNGCEAFQPIG